MCRGAALGVPRTQRVGRLAPPGERSLAAVRSLLPPGVAEALERTAENLVRVAAALYSGAWTRLVVATAGAAEAYRVGDALTVLSGKV